MSDTTEKTIADELREAAARLRGESADATPGPWVRHDTHLDVGGHTATVLTGRPDLKDVGLVAWLPSWSHEPWADHACWANSRWISLVHPGLAEPLASWLESAAWVAREHPQDPDYAGLPDARFCTECNDEETTCVAFIDGALAVARVLNGTAS